MAFLRTKKGGRKKPVGQKVLVGTADSRGNIIVGDYKNSNAVGDVVMYATAGLAAVTVLIVAQRVIDGFVTGEKQKAKVYKFQAALPNVTTGATPEPSILKPTPPPALATAPPITTQVPLPMEQPDITLPPDLTSKPYPGPLYTGTPKLSDATPSPAPKDTRLPTIAEEMKRKPESINYRKMSDNNNSGPIKAVVVPEPWKMNAVEVDSIFNIEDVVVCGWTEIPISSFSVTISFRMSNPPIVQHNKNFFHVVLNTDPFENGLVIAMPGKDHYRVSIGSERNLLFKRPKAYWKWDHEVFQIRFIQLNAETTRIETIFNGHESVLKNEARVPISTIRALPTKVEIKDPFKIENFWVSYAP